MTYSHVLPAVFRSRPNRFLAEVELNGERETVHVKNTGRCRELLVPGCRVWLSVPDNTMRKTKYDLIAVNKERPAAEPIIVNMDSQIPNAAAAEWLPISGLFSEDVIIRREVTFGDSKFDVYLQDGNRRAFLEVKGVTLEEEGTALFPDAPTERGVKHVKELCRALDAGYEAYLLFVIQMKGVTKFAPNVRTHPEFTEALRETRKHGVKILARDCIVTPDSIRIDREIPVEIY